jgi:hypothetical protein
MVHWWVVVHRGPLSTDTHKVHKWNFLELVLSLNCFLSFFWMGPLTPRKNTSVVPDRIWQQIAE